jgi:hypothetical protein
MRLLLPLLLFLVSTCSEKELTLEQYATHSNDLAVKKVTDPAFDFELNVPVEWIWKIEKDYVRDSIVLGVDMASPGDENGFVNTLSIQKVKPSRSEVNIELTHLLIKTQLQNTKEFNFRILESGETNILKRPTFFVHGRSDTGRYGEIEFAYFVAEGNTTGDYYLLSATASRTKDLEKNMSIMLDCLKSFKTN